MKWIKIDCFGNPQVWYSEDVILRIKELAIGYCRQKIHDPDIDKIVDIINEVDNEST